MNIYSDVEDERVESSPVKKRKISSAKKSGSSKKKRKDKKKEKSTDNRSKASSGNKHTKADKKEKKVKKKRVAIGEFSMRKFRISRHNFVFVFVIRAYFRTKVGRKERKQRAEGKVCKVKK